MSDRVENRVRELMAELRRQDEADRPDFVDVVQAASDRSWPRRRRWLRLVPVPAALAAGLVALAVVGGWWPGTTPTPGTDSGTEIADWVAPSTEFLGLADDLSSDGNALSVLADAEEWAMPSDTLMEQADEAFGQEL